MDVCGRLWISAPVKWAHSAVSCAVLISAGPLLTEPAIALTAPAAGRPKSMRLRAGTPGGGGGNGQNSRTLRERGPSPHQFGCSQCRPPVGRHGRRLRHDREPGRYLGRETPRRKPTMATAKRGGQRGRAGRDGYLGSPIPGTSLAQNCIARIAGLAGRGRELTYAYCTAGPGGEGLAMWGCVQMGAGWDAMLARGWEFDSGADPAETWRRWCASSIVPSRGSGAITDARGGRGVRTV